MQWKKHYLLMISCPSDVIKERDLLKECVEQVNNERTDDSWVELKHWITDTFSDAGTPAQESINKQIVHDSDGLIAIFNARLGTPIHNYPCGTAEEINLMLTAGKHVSLLFNTAPRIDLTKDNSIDQITKLQEYKKEQSTKSFYKEFKDEESFKTTALQEIRLWLRSLNNAQGQQNAMTNDTPIVREDDNVSQINNCTEIVNNPADDKVPTNIKEVAEQSQEMGFLDCVLYITDASFELQTLFNNYGTQVENFQVKTDEFVQKFTYANKQNNPANSLALCKKFAIELKEWGGQLETFNNDFESKWNNICSYVKMIPKELISKDDKIIMKSSLASLRTMFSEMMTQVNELISEFDKVPNIQKDFSSALKTVKSAFSRFYKFLGKAIINCEELENFFM